MTSPLIVIRVRGMVNTIADVELTLHQLRLNKVNHAVIIDDTPSYRGMLQRAKDYVVYGPLEKDVLVKLITKRGRAASLGEKIPRPERITDSFIKQQTEFKSIPELANAILQGKTKLTNIDCLKPVFRLHPPKKGFKGSIKRPFKMKGVVGDQGEHVIKLLDRMI